MTLYFSQCTYLMYEQPKRRSGLEIQPQGRIGKPEFISEYDEMYTRFTKLEICKVNL